MLTFKHNLHFTEKDSMLKGFQEVVFSVSNLEREVDFYQHTLDWKIISESKGDSALKQLWQLEEEVAIEEVLLHNEGDHEGFLRLVQFKNVEQEVIRSGAHAWDSGGIFDINLRVHNIEEMYCTFLRAGWHGYSDPLRYTFGIYDVSEVLLKGPDDITIAIMQRFAPPLEGFEHMKTTSRIFNSSTISRDMKATHDFFINQLGFKMFFQSLGLDRKAGHNVLGFPESMNHEISVPIDIVRPDINNYGSIEYLEPQEISGKDCSQLAYPPNLGILMLRFPVKDAVAYASILEERGVEINSPVKELTIEPYGKMKVFSVRSPDGVWLEFMEIV
ncbi:MAG: VOC family protein [Bacteroidota bacterium]